METATGAKKTLTLEERLKQRDRSRGIILTSENPKVGEMTLDEFFSLDPEGQGPNNFAASTYIYVLNLDGGYTRETLIDKLIHWLRPANKPVDDNKIKRATETVDNMVAKELLEVRDGKVYVNMSLV